jgi:hypothetical protein
MVLSSSGLIVTWRDRRRTTAKLTGEPVISVAGILTTRVYLVAAIVVAAALLLGFLGAVVSLGWSITMIFSASYSSPRTLSRLRIIGPGRPR